MFIFSLCVYENLNRWRDDFHIIVLQEFPLNVSSMSVCLFFSSLTLCLTLSLSRSYNWLDFCFLFVLFAVAVTVAGAFLHIQSRNVHCTNVQCIHQPNRNNHSLILYHLFSTATKNNTCTYRIIAIRIM